MELDAEDTLTMIRKSPKELAQLLIQLFDERFGGAVGGKYRISRKFLRKLAGRRKLPDSYLNHLAEEMFEVGFVFVDCESYSIVFVQRQFASYRRVTSVAANKVLSHERGRSELYPRRTPDGDRPTVAKSAGESV